MSHSEAHPVDRKARIVADGSTLVFAALMLLFDSAEHVIKEAIKGVPFARAVDDIGGGTLVGFIASAAVFFIALLPFVTVQEFGRVLGATNVWDFIFTRE